MIGRSDAHATFREMSSESPKGTTIRQKDCEVIETESAAVGLKKSELERTASAFEHRGLEMARAL